MDVIMISRDLYMAYGVTLLGAGAVVGVIVARLLGRRAPRQVPPSPELLQRRLLLLEQELEHTNADVRRLLDDRDFMRELRPPRNRIAAA